tara:strand:+ start:7179 stop:8633 length:1455 start_codon:yes stop_codon:yes gene_type:complete
MADYTGPYSNSTGASPQGISINDTRRMFNFGERIAELAPQQSPFFVYLNKVAKKPTDDPVFKFMEQRHQWQRRNFQIATGLGDTLADAGAIDGGSVNYLAADENLHITCFYTNDGRVSASAKTCDFILPGQIIAVATDQGVAKLRIDPETKIHRHATVSYADAITAETITTIEKVIYHETDAGFTTIAAEALQVVDTLPQDSVVAAGNKGQVIGSAFAEGGKAPLGWEDSLFDREGYTQIFKTAINLFSGTAMATKYRGIANEYQRVWTEKLMEHKMDLEHAFLFGVGHPNGGVAGASSEAAGAPMRTTHGILPYTEKNGKVYNFTYASSGYDAFLDAMEDFFAPESGNSGNKLVLASRKVITYLNKLGAGSFLNNSVGSSQYSLDVQNIKGNFGHMVTKVNTIYGDLHFVADPLLRGPWENYCVGIDMKNVAYRPLSGNGINRDTFIETNIQDNDVDGRKDQIITEAGLEIQLPETHAVMKWS